MLNSYQQEQAFVTKKCIVCKGILEKSSLKGLCICRNCGFITTNLNLSDKEIKELYSINYYNGEEYSDYLSDKKMIQKNFKNRLLRIDKYIVGSKNSLFEIGCAYGFFLDVARNYFKEVSGIDISDEAVCYARDKLSLHVYSGDYLSLQTKNEMQDIICMWDTIEHLKNPDLYIEKIYKCLKPNGLLCITTGDIGSINAKLRGRKWRQIHPPTHLHYFSRKTIRIFLEKRGFEILEISYPSNIISMNTILYTILCLRSNHQKMYNFCKKIRLTNLNISINLHDFMFVIARK